MICYRIVRHGLHVQKHLGRAYATPYFTTITLIVESVLPYTLSGIPFLVSLGVGSITSEAFISVYVMMMVRGFLVGGARQVRITTSRSAFHRKC